MRNLVFQEDCSPLGKAGDFSKTYVLINTDLYPEHPLNSKDVNNS